MPFAGSCLELHLTSSSCQILWGCYPFPPPPIRILKMPARGSKQKQNINFLAPTGSHDVLMWNTDHRKSPKHSSITYFYNCLPDIKFRRKSINSFAEMQKKKYDFWFHLVNLVGKRHRRKLNLSNRT